MRSRIFKDLPLSLTPLNPANGITFNQAEGSIMRVFAQGHKAGLDGVDSTAIKQAIEKVYSENKAYAQAYAAGYTSGRDGHDINKAIDNYLDALERRK